MAQKLTQRTESTTPALDSWMHAVISGDSYKVKLRNLPVSDPAATALADKLDAAEKGAASGVAELDAASLVPQQQISTSLDATFDVAPPGPLYWQIIGQLDYPTSGRHRYTGGVKLKTNSALNYDVELAGVADITLHNLAAVEGFLMFGAASLENVAAPLLETVSRALVINNATALNSYDFAALVNAYEGVSMNYVGGITDFSFPALVNCALVNCNNCPDITTVDLPLLEWYSFQFSGDAALTDLLLPALVGIYHPSNYSAYVQGNNALTNIEFAALEEIDSDCFIKNNSLLTDITLGGAGFLYCYATTLDFQNNAFTQASVDHILTQLAQTDVTGCAIKLQGGTNATPGAAGLAAKATLIAAGNTVTHN